ncbi:MAG: CARDB domain-containing protein [Anaerolineales bacterium]
MKIKQVPFLAIAILAAALLSSCADLIVSNLAYSPSNLTTKSEITFSADVENIGTSASGPSILSFKVGGETHPELYDVPPLDSGETFTVERDVYLNVAQNYLNTVTADAGDNVRELNEDNNEATLSYRVAGSPEYFAGVYYYPWHGTDFHGGEYLRERLVPQQAPELGEYNDRDPSVLGQHLDWSRFAGIQFWITSWWGPGDRTDITTRDHILTHSDIGDVKIALFYETVGRTNEFADYASIGPDIAYIAENYFDHPNYLRVDGKPVLFVYLTRVLSHKGTLGSTLDTMRTTAADAGHQIYIVGDHAFGSPPSSVGDIALLDAITNYDVYGAMGKIGYATQASVDSYYADQSGWKNLAGGAGVRFIPSAAPGFNDKAVRDGHEPLSRKLNADSEFGSLFLAMVIGAKGQVDPDIDNMLMVTSWNEWHEDTQIEPVAAASITSTDDSPLGTEITLGLEYEGYEDRYLEILHNEIDP